MTFSKEEKSAATQVTYQQITNNIGSMSQSQLQQHSPGSSQVINTPLDLPALAELIKSLDAAKSELPPESTALAEYVAELQTLKSQASSPKPKISIVTESLKSMRVILEGTAGSVLASGLVPQIAAFLAPFS